MVSRERYQEFSEKLLLLEWVLGVHQVDKVDSPLSGPVHETEHGLAHHFQWPMPLYLKTSRTLSTSQKKARDTIQCNALQSKATRNKGFVHRLQ